MAKAAPQYEVFFIAERLSRWTFKHNYIFSQ